MAAAGPISIRLKHEVLVFAPSNRRADQGARDGEYVPLKESRRGLRRLCDEIDLHSRPPTPGGLNACDELRWHPQIESNGRVLESRQQSYDAPGQRIERFVRHHRPIQPITYRTLPELAR